MSASGPPWALRTVSRGDLIDDILAMHFAHGFLGMPEAQARGQAEAALDRWLALGLGHAGGAGAAARFDPVEALNFMVAAGVAGRDRFWEDNHVACERRQIVQMQADPAADPAAGPEALGAASFAPRRFRVRLERAYNLAALAPGTRVRLRLPLPIEDAVLRVDSLDVHAPPGAAVRRDAARLDAGFVLERPGMATLGVTLALEARADGGLPGPLCDAERELYTRPHEDLIQVTPRIRREAEALVAGLPAHDPAARVAAIVAMIFDRWRMGAVPYHAIDRDAPGEWPFESGFFDCQIGAALLCAMCRALGMPARLCGGFQLYRPNTCYHYWAQVWLPDRGWLTFDLSNWHLSLGGRDARWRGALLGWADMRLKTQLFPHLFTGASTRRLPATWHKLRKRLPDGTETRFLDAATGELVYRERLVHLPDGQGAAGPASMGGTAA